MSNLAHFIQVRFWGKVRGLQRDYLICQGTIDEMGNVAPFDAKKVTFKRSLPHLRSHETNSTYLSLVLLQSSPHSLTRCLGSQHGCRSLDHSRRC